MSDQRPVRVRVAPSPTGYFNVATARVALYNWLFAKQHNGTFILRIEDTDRERSREEYDTDIKDSLKWLGLEYTESYRQTDRTNIYKKYLQNLLNSGAAFYCPHTHEELEHESEVQKQNKEILRHTCSARDARGTTGIIRLKNNASDIIKINDIVRGLIEFDPTLLGDFSLAKSLNEALYNFAVTVDDSEMNISHVIRGEDHISNTPKQILVAKALNFTLPEWAHLPLLLGSDRSKLSKRHGGLSIKEYREKGYLAEAMINFIALLGWHPSTEDRGKTEQEIFSRAELIKLFSLNKIQKGGAIVALEKLNWFNKEYLKATSSQELMSRAESFLLPETRAKLKPTVLEKIISSLKNRITTLSELESEIQHIITIPKYSLELLLWKDKLTKLQTSTIIDNIITIFSNISLSDFSSKTTEQALAPLIEKDGKGAVLWPLRAALSGMPASIGPFELTDILGKELCLLRLKTAQKLLI